MSEMSGTGESTYPWLADGGDASVDGESGNGTESGHGAEPTMNSEAAATYGAEASVVADSTPSMHDTGKEPAVPFLQSLVDAMRKIADQTRDDVLGNLRAAVAERSAAIRADNEKRAAELHQQADADVASVAGWEQGEVQRIREAAAAKVAARNATLDAQVAANTAAGEGAMASVQARVDAFEAEINSFYAQLNDIQDPAQLAAALKRIPQAPSFADPVAAAAGDTAPSPAVVVPAEPEATPVAQATPAPEPAPQPAADSMSEVAASAAPDAEMPTPAPEEMAASAPAAVAVATASEPVLESEVIEMPVVEEAVEETGEEMTTQVLVSGLTSFGAITSFKQSLERVSGIRRVALGLGTSGEFIFTATHRAGFDLSAAIRSFEETAQFVASNGQLRVTVGAKA